jgi:hypothetical protein
MPDDFTHQGESAAAQWVKFPYFVRTIDTTEFADENYLLQWTTLSAFKLLFCVHSSKCLFSACRNFYNGDFENECH